MIVSHKELVFVYVDCSLPEEPWYLKIQSHIYAHQHGTWVLTGVMLGAWGLLLVTAASAVYVPSERSLRDLVERYAEMGSHLTGSLSDTATSNWIYQELRAAGLEVQFQKYQVPGTVWIPNDGVEGFGCQLLVDGQHVPCYVVQQPPLAPPTLKNVPMKRVLVVSSNKVKCFRKDQKSTATIQYPFPLPIWRIPLKSQD